MARYFGFAFSLSMLTARENEATDLTVSTITPEWARTLISDGVVPCLNPSHTATIDAMRSRFGISVEIPETAPRVELTEDDELIVLQVSGLPRLGGDRHEYTDEEIARASFSFKLVVVGSTYEDIPF